MFYLLTPYLARDLCWTDEAETLCTFRLLPTTDKAANATLHDWILFIPCDSGTGMEHSSS